MPRADNSRGGSGYSDRTRTRLRLEDFVKRHPEALDVAMERPIIVVGLPRSGTTHLLNLIAADRRLRSMPYWESLEPVPVPGEAPGADGIDPRILRCRKGHELQSTLMPLLRNMHDMSLEHVHEEIELKGPDFSTYTMSGSPAFPAGATTTWPTTSAPTMRT